MSVTAPLGFVAAGLHAGIKHARPDMALLASADLRPLPTAAVFTSNLFVAPPVELDRALLEANGGQASAVIINSGNANAGTGAKGRADAEAMGEAAARALGVPAGDVLVCSTGIIGTLLPIERILAAAPKLAAGLSRTGAEDAALGILTTDSRPKQVVVEGSGFCVGGMAKGCGMIAPNMATMLAFLTTDAEAPRAELQKILAEAAQATFNCLDVDGATSTNDTALLMASGRRGPAPPGALAKAVHEACEALTLQMARDAEGMTRMARLTVTGAASNAEAKIAAREIARNNLVKCSWHGGDPYWGRLLAAAGSAGVAFDCEGSQVAYDGIVVARGGAPVQHDEKKVAAHMKRDAIDIRVDLGAGDSEARMIGVDLGPGYIDENVKTS